MGVDTVVLLATAAIAAMLTFFVNERLGQGPVRSSAGLSLLVGLWFHFFPHCLADELAKNIPIVFIGGSFIGMVSAKLLSSYLKIGAAGLIFCALYLNSSQFFNGYGGAMGTAASIALLTILSLPLLNIKGKLTTGLQQLRKLIYKGR